jgi:hypothetical protein
MDDGNGRRLSVCMSVCLSVCLSNKTKQNKTKAKSNTLYRYLKHATKSSVRQSFRGSSRLSLFVVNNRLPSVPNWQSLRYLCARVWGVGATACESTKLQSRETSDKPC